MNSRNIVSTKSGRALHRLLQACAVAIVLGLASAAPGTAQQPETYTAGEGSASQEGAPETRLVLLGTGGGPIVRTKRSAPANLLIVRGRHYMIDAGMGSAMRLKQAGVDIGQVGNLFLTHLHFDHTGELTSLMLLNWLGGGHKLDVWGPSGTSEMVRGALGYLAINEALYTAILPPRPPVGEVTRAHDVSADAQRTLIFQDDLVRVYAVENSHYSVIPAEKKQGEQWSSYAYRFETPDKIIVFTGDTGPSPAVVELAKGADILVSEVVNVEATKRYLKATQPGLSDEQLEPLLEHTLKQHLSPPAVGKLAQEAGVKKVVLSHVAPGLDGETDTASYISGVKEYFSGPVVLGEDLQEF